MLPPAVVAVTAMGCAGAFAAPATTRQSARPLVASANRALVIVLSERPPEPWPSMIRVLDEKAEIVADVPAGADAVFEAEPGAHVFSAFMGLGHVPFDAACIGALRATLAPGRTYAVRIWKGNYRRAGKRRCTELELVAARGQATRKALASVHARVMEILPSHARPHVVGDDIDVREAVVGLAKLRMAGDRPMAFALPEDLRAFAETPPHAPWSADVSVLTEDDGV